jgi:hypothetical protein
MEGEYVLIGDAKSQIRQPTSDMSLNSSLLNSGGSKQFEIQENRSSTPDPSESVSWYRVIIQGYQSEIGHIARLYTSGFYLIFIMYFFWELITYSDFYATPRGYLFVQGSSGIGILLGCLVASLCTVNFAVSPFVVLLICPVVDVIGEVAFLLYPTAWTDGFSAFFHGIGAIRVPFFFFSNYIVSRPKFRGMSSTTFIIPLTLAYVASLMAIALGQALLPHWNAADLSYLLRLVGTIVLIPLEVIIVVFPSVQLPGTVSTTPKRSYLSRCWEIWTILKESPWIPLLYLATLFYSMLVFTLFFMVEFYYGQAHNFDVTAKEFLGISLVLGVGFGYIFGGMLVDHVGNRRNVNLVVFAFFAFIFIFPCLYVTLFSLSPFWTFVLIGLAVMLSYMVILLLLLSTFSHIPIESPDLVGFANLLMYAAAYFFATIYFGLSFAVPKGSPTFDVGPFLFLITVCLLGPLTLMVVLVIIYSVTEARKRKGQLLSTSLAQSGIESETMHDICLRLSTQPWWIKSSAVTLQEHIGSGGAALLRKGIYLGSVVAVKIMHKLIGEEELLAKVVNEIENMAVLRHPHITQFFGAVLESGHYCLVMEYCQHGNLYDFLRTGTPEQLCGRESLRMASEITLGLSYLHSLEPPIVHRDLKSMNVLVGENYRMKLCDFGESREAIAMSSHTLTLVGTPMWLAPEVISRRIYNITSDVYALGIVLHEIVTAEDPFPATLFPTQILAAVLAGQRPTMLSWIRSDVKRLISLCLSEDPMLRPSTLAIGAALAVMEDWDFVEKAGCRKHTHA